MEEEGLLVAEDEWEWDRGLRKEEKEEKEDSGV